MKRYLYQINLFFGLLIVSNVALSYKEQTHEKISEESLGVSTLNKLETLSNFGLLYSISDPKQKFPGSDNQSRNITDLVKFGGNSEDTGNRSLNHFYNPRNNKPLTVIGITPGYTSPGWALEKNGAILG